MKSIGVALRAVVAPSLLIAAGLTGLLALASRAGLLRVVELPGYDALLSLRTSEGPSEKLVVVDFDDASVRELRAFPIPRHILARLVDRISEGGPLVIGLDVILDWPRPEGGDGDARLAEAIGRAGNVILVSAYGFGLTSPAEPLPLFSREAAADPAFADMPVDEDGLVRRLYLVGTAEYPRLSFPVAMASYASERVLEPAPAGGYTLGPVHIPLQTSRPDSALIGYRGGPPARVVTVNEVVAHGFDAAIFREKIVLVGQSSAFGKDLFHTPVDRFRPAGPDWRPLSGAEIHAAAIDTLLQGRTVHSAGGVAVWSGIFLLVTLSILLLILLRPLAAVPSVLALAAAIFLAALYLLDARGIWFPHVTAETGAVLSLPAGLGYRYLQERRLKTRAEAERRQMMGLFERYVAPEVAAQIWQRRDEIVLAGEERTATVLFADIRSFTALTAGKPSAEVLAWLNRYLAAMSEIVRSNGGFLNKYLGDGIMVLFGVPLSQGTQDDAIRAVRAALQMLARVEELNAARLPGQPELRIGIGIHTGPLTAGSVGSPDRMEYSVIGETVNLASRLESLTKQYDVMIILGPRTRDLVKGVFRTDSLGPAEVRGFEGAIPLYSVRSGTPSEVPS